MMSSREIVDFGPPTKRVTAARTATRPPIAAGRSLPLEIFTTVQPDAAMMACGAYCSAPYGHSDLDGDANDQMSTRNFPKR
jgi:hypothetical protein